MRKILLLLLAVSTCALALSLSNKAPAVIDMNRLSSLLKTDRLYPYCPIHQPLDQIQTLLNKESSHLSPALIKNVITAIKCANQSDIKYKPILTIIDFSLPSSEKRLWIFDLAKNKLLFHTYVSHGIKSGFLKSRQFSNVNNSKASSLGVFNTGQSYYGRHGLSLRLAGLERGFNDNAMRRYIVMHGSWYVNDAFIQRYGRPGRSWGCPAIPKHLTRPIINTIKDDGLFMAFYPGQEWLLGSKFLNCGNISPLINAVAMEEHPSVDASRDRDHIIFADVNGNNKREENEPIVVMSAQQYERIFKAKAPLPRMLRRQINDMEYIALSQDEFKQLDVNHDKTINHEDKEGLSPLYFVIPEVKLTRGYYATEMKVITLGQVKEIKLQEETSVGNESAKHTLHFEKKTPIDLKFTNRFIRWLGL